MFLIAFLGGILTVLSPCILPVVPFLFAGVKRTRSSILLTLGGMALTFALISSLAVVSSDWVVQASNTGRHVALIVMVLFALSLISARIGGWLARPFVLLGNRIDPNTRKVSGPFGSLMIGVATGLLWAPCAGPILGVILTGAMLQGANAQTSLLLVAYGLGSALSPGHFDLRRSRPGQSLETVDSAHRLAAPRHGGCGVGRSSCHLHWRRQHVARQHLVRRRHHG